MCSQPTKRSDRRRPPIFKIASSFLLMLLFSSGAEAGDELPSMTPLSAQDRALLASAVGNSDESALLRLASRLGTQKLVYAFYKGTRQERLIALDAAAFLEEPSDILPSLIALMGAQDRQTAERAAATVSSVLVAPKSVENKEIKVIPNQAAQLMSRFQGLALDTRLEADVRVVAATAWESLAGLGKTSDLKWSIPLIDDAELAVRRTAVGLQQVPLSEELLMKFAKTAKGDPDPNARGLASTMLCENALAHGVKDPSQDLAALLIGSVRDDAIPVDIEAGIFSCLTQFSPEGRRRDIVEAALASKNPEVPKLVEGMKLK